MAAPADDVFQFPHRNFNNEVALFKNFRYMEDYFERILGIIAVLDHGALLGLGDDDHPQYFGESNSAEISALANKAVPVAADFLLIEDSASGDSKAHVTLAQLGAGLGLGSTYLRLDTSNDPLTGSLATQEILPSAAATYDIGSAAVPFLQVYGYGGTFVSGGYMNLTRDPNYGTGGIVAGSAVGSSDVDWNFGTGIAEPIMLLGATYGGGYPGTLTNDAPGGLVMGGVYATGGTVTVASTAAHGLLGGYAYIAYPTTGTSYAYSQSSTSFVWGYPNAYGGSYALLSSYASYGSFTLGHLSGYGDLTMQTYQAHGAFVAGRVRAYNAGGSGIIEANGGAGYANGAFVQGAVDSAGANDAVIRGSDYGSFAQGFVYGDGQLLSGGAGSFAQGNINESVGGATGYINASANGAFAQGYLNVDEANNNTQLLSSGLGSFAQGVVRGRSRIQAAGPGAFAQGRSQSTQTAGETLIYASAQGSFAQGRSNQQGQIRAESNGAFAQGNASGGQYILASGSGSFAKGAATGAYNILASQTAAFAFGNASGADIIASAINSAQFFPGTNATATSLQVGDTGYQVQLYGATGGIRIDGPINHDGATVGFFGTAPAVQPAAWTPTNVVADRAFDANATTVNELADALGTLIADLQTLGLVG